MGATPLWAACKGGCEDVVRGSVTAGDSHPSRGLMCIAPVRPAKACQLSACLSVLMFRMQVRLLLEKGGKLRPQGLVRAHGTNGHG